MYTGKLDRRVERVVCDLRCSDCPENGRCADCQDTIDAAIAATLAAGIGPEHIHVKPA
jgi:hypothetical protein